MTSLWLDMLGAEVRYRGREFKTRTIETGAHNPKKLILLHGVGGHAEAYAKNMTALGERYHAISMDLLWHGLSSKPAFTPEMIPMHARQIMDLLDDLGVQKAAINGESLGGWVAAWTALNYPDRVDKVVLNTMAGVRWNRDKVVIDEAAGRIALRERSIAAVRNPSRDTIRTRLEWLMASPDRVTDELIDLRYAMYTRPDTNASLQLVFGQIGADELNTLSEDDLGKINVPALALWSEKNPGAGADVGERLAALIPGASHYCIGDAGHWPQWEKPDEYNAAVLAFLDGKPLPKPPVPA